MPATTPPKPKRRWFQFSLRALLLFVLACSIPCAWLGVKVREAKRRQHVANRLRDAGWWIRYDFEPKLFTGPLGTNSTPPGPDWLREFLGTDFFGNVVEAAPSWAAIGHPLPWNELHDLPHLQYLHFALPIPDDEMEHLHDMTQLKGLRLRSENLTGAGFDKLRRALPKCEIKQYGS